MLNKRVALYFLSIFWIVVLVLWPKQSNIPSLTVGLRQAEAEEGLYKAPLTQANFGLLGIRYYETAAGKKHWNIRSKFAELHRKDNYAYMQVVDADFYAEKTGNIVATKSNYGRSLIDKHLVELEGDVSVHSKRGYLFTMDKMNYDGNAHEFLSDDVVHMKGPNVERPSMLLTGVGLMADIDTEHFLLHKNVSALRKLKNADWIHINSRSGEFFTEEQRAVFVGKVHSSLPNLTINSDVFEITVSTDGESLLASGNVDLKHRDRIGRAEYASIDVGSNQIILKGHARVNSKNHEMRGRQIVMRMNEDNDQIDVYEAEGKVGQ